jgi:hypothetical protein
MADEDKIYPTPIFFYTHFNTWFQSALKVSNAFDAASQCASDTNMHAIAPQTRSEVIDYCRPYDDEDSDTNNYDLVNIYPKIYVFSDIFGMGNGRRCGYGHVPNVNMR